MNTTAIEPTPHPTTIETADQPKAHDDQLFTPEMRFPDTFDDYIQHPAVLKHINRIAGTVEQDVHQQTLLHLLTTRATPDADGLRKLVFQIARQMRYRRGDDRECLFISNSKHEYADVRTNVVEEELIATIDQKREGAVESEIETRFERACRIVGEKHANWMIEYENGLYKRPARHTPAERKRYCLLRKRVGGRIQPDVR